MPFYLCTMPPSSLDYGQRHRIANEITSIHCEETGAPDLFVHVAFVDASDPDANAYTVFGTIRAGRTSETKATLIARMAKAVASCASIEESRVMVRTADVPASWVMEGGELLPEPGEEAEWLAANEPAALGSA